MKATTFIKCTLACLILLLVGCSSTGTTGTRTQPEPTTTQAPPTSTPQGDWQTYVDPNFGFHLDIPTIIAATVPSVSNRTETGVFWEYDRTLGTPPASQEVFAEVRIDLDATTGQPGATYPCTTGTPITIGSGIRAYEDDSLDFSPPTSGQPGGHGVGGFNVNLVTGGVFITFGLEGGDWLGNQPINSAAAFRARYGPIWQHILNSFVPGPAVPNGHLVCG